MTSGSGKHTSDDRAISKKAPSEVEESILREVRICNDFELGVFPLIVNASLFLSNSIRRDTRLVIKVEENLVLVIDPRKVRRLYPDSESILGILRAIKGGKEITGIDVNSACPPPSFENFLECSLNNIRLPVVIDPSKLNCLSERYPLDQVVIISHIIIDRFLEGKEPL
ncbi:hypothetical protein EYM_07890 [Ignicoccus islandicus DSM 13165]|uniref:Uncharacterized protein n=1 Tax=Ignicoccus islandicus DSM 13165 TaxID=940295 RepID=A0A0U2MBV9_9CREN|nr:hypothetical protein EYM_07890 [Ignicoccus islandicus DSM 13165]